MFSRIVGLPCSLPRAFLFSNPGVDGVRDRMGNARLRSDTASGSCLYRIVIVKGSTVNLSCPC